MWWIRVTECHNTCHNFDSAYITHSPHSSLAPAICKLCQLYPLLDGDWKLGLGRWMQVLSLFSATDIFPKIKLSSRDSELASLWPGLYFSPTMLSVFTWDTFWGLRNTPGSPVPLCEASCWSLHVTASLGSLLPRAPQRREGWESNKILAFPADFEGLDACYIF